MSSEPLIEEEVHYCTIHPDRETELRCKKCDRYMCVQCAVRTPVGYICRECDRQHDDKFFTGTNRDYMIVGAVCGIGSLVASAIVQIAVFPLFAFFIGAAVGSGISALARRLTGNRVGRQSAAVAAGTIVAGALIVLLFTRGINLIGMVIYMVSAAMAAFAIFSRRI